VHQRNIARWLCQSGEGQKNRDSSNIRLRPKLLCGPQLSYEDAITRVRPANAQQRHRRKMEAKKHTTLRERLMGVIHDGNWQMGRGRRR
jgi:hypothetical protein